MNILIAEDDKDIADTYKKTLEDRKHKVIIASNDEECLNLYHENYRM